MCNDYERHIKEQDYARALAAAQLEAAKWQEPPPPIDDVRVGDVSATVVASGNGVALTPMRWGFAPERKGRAPVFNFRGDGRRFGKSRRCIVPASAFFEFTGTRSPKSKWRFALPGEPVVGIAGLWHDEPDGPSFTMLTVAPGEDVAPFHDRQIAVLAPAQWADWLYLTRPESELLAPLPPGSLVTTLVRKGTEPVPDDLQDLASRSSVESGQ